MADDDQILETQQGSAGFAQRPFVPDPLAAAADFPEIPRELTPEELDARQASIDTERRSGPPLPEGETNNDASGLAFGNGGDAAQRAEATEVKEPPDNS